VRGSASAGVEDVLTVTEKQVCREAPDPVGLGTVSHGRSPPLDAYSSSEDFVAALVSDRRPWTER